METKSTDGAVTRSHIRLPFIPAWMRPLIKELTPAEWYVLSFYISHAGKDGMAWPSLLSLRGGRGKGKNTVQAAKSGITKRGLMVAEKQDRSSGKFGKRAFRVDFEAMLTVAQKLGSGKRSTVTHSTDAPSTDAPKQGKEGISNTRYSKRKVARSQKSDDAGLRAPALPAQRNRKGKLQERLEAKIASEDITLKEHLDEAKRNHRITEPDFQDWWERLEMAFAAMRYKLDPDSRVVTLAFVDAAIEVWEEHRDAEHPPGILCTKLIDLCQRNGWYWPPDFQDRRDRLRAEERDLEAAKVEK